MISSVRLEGIYKQYGAAQFSLSIDNLEFHNKHIQVLVGPNGAGKSTLLNLLAFLECPDQGNIRVDGKPLFHRRDSKHQFQKRIGFVQQSPYLFNLDVFENVALGLKIRKYSKGDTVCKVNNMLATLKIDHLKKRRVKSLSRGEYQKVAIAQVLVLEPEMILMDEPAANIDTQSMLSIEKTVKNVQKRNNSLIVMTTHSLTQAYRMSPDIVSMREGRIVGFVHENVFYGQINDFAGGLQCIHVCEGVPIVFSTEKRGNSYIAIDPENIVLSQDAVKTSARNTFRGKIVKMESLGINIRLLIDVGVPIYSIITKQSFEEMDITLDSTVCVSFKVNSVEVI